MATRIFASFRHWFTRLPRIRLAVDPSAAAQFPARRHLCLQGKMITF